MASSLVAGSYQNISADASGTTVTFGSVSWAANDLVMFHVGYLGGQTSVSVSDNGAQGLTEYGSGQENTNGTPAPAARAYFFIATSAGTMTPTFTLGAARTFRRGQCAVMRAPSGTFSLDAVNSAEGLLGYSGTINQSNSSANARTTSIFTYTDTDIGHGGVDFDDKLGPTTGRAKLSSGYFPSGYQSMTATLTNVVWGMFTSLVFNGGGGQAPGPLISNPTATANGQTVTISATIVQSGGATMSGVTATITDGLQSLGPFNLTKVGATDVYSGSIPNVPTNIWTGSILATDSAATAPAVAVPSVEILAIGGDPVGPNPLSGLPSVTGGPFTVLESQTVCGVLTIADGDQSSGHTTAISGPDAALFALVAVPGQAMQRQLVFLSAPNYEIPLDVGANNVYNITITATDSANNVTNPLAVVVTVVNQVEAINVAGATTGLTGSSTTLTLTDENGAPIQAATAAWVGPSGGAISGASNGFGQISIVRSATPGSYNLRITFGSLTVDVGFLVQAPPAISSIDYSPGFGGTVATTDSINVIVRDVNGDFVQGASVQIECQNPALLSSTTGTTNAQGLGVISVTYAATGSALARIKATRGSEVFATEWLTLLVHPVTLANQLPAIETAETNPKFSEELFPYPFAFASLLGTDEAIESVLSVTCESVPPSFDPAAQKMIVGKPAILGKTVLQYIEGGLRQGTYVVRITVKATRSRPTAELRIKVYQSIGKRA